MNEVEKASLHFTDGRSDKVYHAQILGDEASGYVVNFQYGRRGSSLTAGSKTNGPVPLDVARTIFGKLIKEKSAKGYVAGEDGTPFTNGETAARATGISPQLLNEVDDADVPALVSSREWFAQEKHDGERRLVQKKGGIVTGINRKGLTVPLPAPIHDAVAGLSEVLLDGEQIGDVLYVFDVLEDSGVDLRGFPYSLRASRMETIFEPIPANSALQMVAIHSTPEAKQSLINIVRARHGEGVVFKRASAPFKPGKPNSGGDHLKHKFVATATVLVLKQNAGTRSVLMGVRDENGQMVEIGNVTIPPNHAVPEPGALVEVRYLYAFKGGSLFQSAYLGPRSDLEEEAAVLKQLKYKAA